MDSGPHPGLIATLRLPCMYLRLQDTPDAQYKLPGQSGPTTPVLYPSLGFKGINYVTMAIYVNI